MKQTRHMKRRYSSFHQWLLFIDINYCSLKINPPYAILHIKIFIGSVIILRVNYSSINLLYPYL